MSVLSGKTALVTGGSRGIGRAIVERLAGAGAAVAFNYARSAEAAEAIARGIKNSGGKAFALQADVAQSAEVRRLFDGAEKALGALDIVVANAGVYMQKPLAECTEADYDYVFNTNTRGVFFTLQEAARRLRDGGRIIVISTGGTKMHFPDASLYLGSKGAIEQFARSLALELGPRRIAVNVLSPGFTATDMLPSEFREYAESLSPFRRVGEPEDVADVALFLAGDESRWVTAQNLQAGGGVV